MFSVTFEEMMFTQKEHWHWFYYLFKIKIVTILRIEKTLLIAWTRRYNCGLRRKINTRCCVLFMWVMLSTNNFNNKENNNVHNSIQKIRVNCNLSNIKNGIKVKLLNITNKLRNRTKDINILSRYFFHFDHGPK